MGLSVADERERRWEVPQRLCCSSQGSVRGRGQQGPSRGSVLSPAVCVLQGSSVRFGAVGWLSVHGVHWRWLLLPELSSHCGRGRSLCRLCRPAYNVTLDESHLLIQGPVLDHSYRRCCQLQPATLAVPMLPHDTTKNINDYKACSDDSSSVEARGLNATRTPPRCRLSANCFRNVSERRCCNDRYLSGTDKICSPHCHQTRRVAVCCQRASAGAEEGHRVGGAAHFVGKLPLWP